MRYRLAETDEVGTCFIKMTTGYFESLTAGVFEGVFEGVLEGVLRVFGVFLRVRREPRLM